MATKLGEKKFKCVNCGCIKSYDFEYCYECGVNNMTLQDADELYDEGRSKNDWWKTMVGVERARKVLYV